MTIKSIRTGWTGISAAAGNILLGDFESIATVTVGSGGQGTIEFTSIPATYNHLQVRALVSSTAGSSATLRFNGDTTTSNYRQHHIEGIGSGTPTSGTVANNLYAPYNSGGAVTVSPGAMILDILDYTNTNKYKTIRYLGGYDANGSGILNFASGLWLSSNAITSMVFTLSFNQHSHFALYGIRG